MPMTQDERTRIIESILSIPLHSFLDFRLVSSSNSQAVLKFTVGRQHLTPNGTLHGGITISALDVTCLLAALSVLEQSESAATVHSSTQNLAAGMEGDEVTVIATVTKRTKRFLFCIAEASRGETILARSTITKSIIGVKI